MPTAWTQLTRNQTIIRAHHIAELRTALTAELTRRGLAVRATYTDDVEDMPGKPIRAIHVQEIVDKLQNIKTAGYTDSPIAANKTVVKSLHQEEIRTMINVLETAPQVGGVTTCNAGCTGLCVSCSGTCTGGCTSCSGSCTSCTGCKSCSGSCNVACGGSCYNCCYSCSGYCASSCVVQCSSCVSGCNSNCTSSCHSGCQNASRGMTNHNNPYT